MSSSGSSSPDSRSPSPLEVRLGGFNDINNDDNNNNNHNNINELPYSPLAPPASSPRHSIFSLQRLPAPAGGPPWPGRRPTGPTPDWQTTSCKVADRGRHLLDTGLWSDCDFIVGHVPNIRIFHCHKIFLAMASPVFEAMFFGGLAETRREIKILDVQPEAFASMLEYVYTDEIHLSNFELVCDICYAAKKYMLPEVVEECTKFLWRGLYPRNACRALEFAKLFEEPVLQEKALQIITHQTMDVIGEPTWEDIEQGTLGAVLRRDSLAAPESVMFEAMDRWAARECDRRGVESTGDSKRLVLGDTLFLIRYLTLSAAEFAAGPAQSGILLQQESFSILMNISCPGSWELPEHMRDPPEPRKAPGRVVEPAGLPLACSRHWCKRAMMQEPPCLNTSILDCSVTFTVDKDVWIHGLEVPSQVTDVPEQLVVSGVRVRVTSAAAGPDAAPGGAALRPPAARRRLHRAALRSPARRRGAGQCWPLRPTPPPRASGSPILTSRPRLTGIQ
jgi:hypothetical protein